MKYLKIITVLLFVLNSWFCKSPKSKDAVTTAPTEIEQEAITLSADKKTIKQGENTILAIDDNDIFNWFKTESGLCNKSNNDSENRNSFCYDSTVFLAKTSFVNIHPTKNKKYIAIEISSKEMLPDMVLGIYNRETKKINWLTNYYLGNKFISFSPNEDKFVYSNRCWEALCGLTIKDIGNYTTIKEINNPQYVDARSSNAIFNKWIDNNTINYTLKSHTIGSKEFTESI